MKDDLLEYKGYIAQLTFDLNDNIIVGHVVNTAEIIGFHADNLSEIRSAFEEMIDTYLEACESAGIPVSKPYSGEVSLNIAPSLHKELRIEAAKDNISLRLTQSKY